jgi:hypothetical protein
VREAARDFPYPPTPDLAHRRLPPRTARRGAALFRLAAALLLVLVLFATLSVPAVRATVAEFVRIGPVRLWRTPPKFSPGLPAQYEVGGEPVALEAVQYEVWYPIRLPGYPDGLGPPDAVYLLSPQEDGVYLVWHATGSHPELRLTQFGSGFWIEKWGPALEDATPSVRVNGRYAVWAPGPHVWYFFGNGGDRTVVVPKGYNVLIWTEGDVTYRLESRLPQEEAIQVAESLR